jgi:hypothetical protein
MHIPWSGGSGFESLSEDWLSWQGFRCFLQCLKTNSGIEPQIGPRLFVPISFLIYYSAIRRKIVRATDSVVNRTTTLHIRRPLPAAGWRCAMPTQEGRLVRRVQAHSNFCFLHNKAAVLRFWRFRTQLCCRLYEVTHCSLWRQFYYKVYRQKTTLTKYCYPFFLRKIETCDLMWPWIRYKWQT